jgi:hypothetical protein
MFDDRVPGREYLRLLTAAPVSRPYRLGPMETLRVKEPAVARDAGGNDTSAMQRLRHRRVASW